MVEILEAWIPVLPLPCTCYVVWTRPWLSLELSCLTSKMKGLVPCCKSLQPQQSQVIYSQRCGSQDRREREPDSEGQEGPGQEEVSRGSQPLGVLGLGAEGTGWTGLSPGRPTSRIVPGRSTILQHHPCASGPAGSASPPSLQTRQGTDEAKMEPPLFLSEVTPAKMGTQRNRVEALGQPKVPQEGNLETTLV